MFNGKVHYKWSFSITMLNYQRVNHGKSQNHRMGHVPGPGYVKLPLWSLNIIQSKMHISQSIHVLSQRDNKSHCKPIFYHLARGNGKLMDSSR